MADTDASVFNMSNVTITADIAQAFAEDAKVPIKDGIGKGDIRSPGFLTGINAGFADNIHDGIDQTIIKGDQVTEIKGNQYRKVNSNRSTHIVGEEELKVDGMRTTEVCSDDTLTVQGDHSLKVKGSVDTMITGGQLQTIFGPKVINEVSRFVEWKGDEVLQVAKASASINLIGKADIFQASVEAGFWKRDFIVSEEERVVINIHQTIVRMQQQMFMPVIVLFGVRTGGPYIHGMLPIGHPGF